MELDPIVPHHHPYAIHESGKHYNRFLPLQTNLPIHHEDTTSYNPSLQETVCKSVWADIS